MGRAGEHRLQALLRRPHAISLLAEAELTWLEDGEDMVYISWDVDVHECLFLSASGTQDFAAKQWTMKEVTRMIAGQADQCAGLNISTVLPGRNQGEKRADQLLRKGEKLCTSSESDHAFLMSKLTAHKRLLAIDDV